MGALVGRSGRLGGLRGRGDEGVVGCGRCHTERSMYAGLEVWWSGVSMAL